MDAKIICGKLVGSEEERAVSPVIGVILMVAITVILAAVIAAFVLDIGDDMGDGSVNAAVSTDISNSEGEITFTVTEVGDAERFVVRGDEGDGEDIIDHDSANNATDGGEVELYFGGVGTTHTLEETEASAPSPDDDDVLAEEGSVNIVAIDGNSESVIGSVDWDFSDS